MEMCLLCHSAFPFFFTWNFMDLSKAEHGEMENKSKRKASCSTVTSPKLENRRSDDIPESKALFSAVRPLEMENKETEDAPRNKAPCSAVTSPTSEDKGMKGYSTCDKFLYSFVIAFMWLFFFFVDGRYVSCACSHWGGK